MSNHLYKHKIITLFGFFLMIFLIIEARLWYMQVLLGEYYRMRADQMHRSMEAISSPRGEITDRNGEILAQESATFDIYLDRTVDSYEIGLIALTSLLREHRADAAAVVRELERAGIVNSAEDREEAESPRNGALSLLAHSVSYDIAERICVLQKDYPGIVVKLETRRTYPHRDLACHVLGYLGPMQEGEPERLIPRGYRISDSLGRGGVELVREEDLRGRRGGRVVERDYKHGGENVLMEIAPRLGRRVQLTLDLELQKTAEEALGDRTSAVVMMDINNGDILVMASRPGYDPTAFCPPRSNREVAATLKDARKPMVNRVIQGSYPLGSVFKMVTGIAGLEEGVLASGTTHNCTGSYDKGSISFGCWKKWGHGEIDIEQALQQSCNVYFYWTGDRLGGRRLCHWAESLGFGSLTGVDLPYEREGYLPAPGNIRGAWSAGESINLSIGQGQLLVSPIQVARYIAAIANGGYLVKPRVMASTPVEKTKLGIRPSTLDKVRRGMWRVVNSPMGTGKAAALSDVDIAGKTSTAQTGKAQDHAWFACFAPYQNPQVCLVVFMEFGGKGGAVAAPVAQTILSEYFKRPIKVYVEDYEE